MGKTAQTQNPPLPPHLLHLTIWSWSVQRAQQHSCSTLRNNSSKVYVCACERGMGYVVKEYCSFSTAELSIVPRLLYTRVLLSRTARQKIQPSFLESPWNTQSLQIKSLIQNTMQLNTVPSEVQWQAETGQLLVVVSDYSHLCHVPKSLCVQQHKSVSFFTGVRDTPHPDALGLWFNSAAESKAWDNHSISIMQLVFRCAVFRQQRPYTPLMINGTPVERVSSFKYLGVNISEDLTWTTHIQTQVKKARQRLYHLRQLRKFRVSPAILKTFYSGAIESVLTQCISVWYGNSSNQDCKALQRVVRLAERISGSTLPSLQGIYIKRCKSRAAKIIKDSNHPGNHLFCLLPSGRRFRSMMAKTERLRKSFFPQAIRLLNTNSVS